MPEFHCSKCGQRVQSEAVSDARLCPACCAATAVATPEDAAKAKVTPPASSVGAFSEGLPPAAPAPPRVRVEPPTTLSHGVMAVMVVLALLGMCVFLGVVCNATGL